ncbi:PEP-CTERM sorting domain-containing protein [Bythopirellula polymerisocia]|uniref:Dockerin domain-containing protein n=1 Tax=Bythopirellula polymerisocia TaxID=2528003 RepID=A0A5C6CVN3_9BACT|nr:PEP-CTERM sorting domain-containing protein [Bythopirellula polymerisocia]TWU27885.1 hypothetical protein Pla144_26620 [Bythopirellula polymerisocia]
MTRQQSLITYASSIAICFAWAIPGVFAGVSYLNPAGGWRYTYDGTFNPGVTDGVAGTGDDKFIGDFGPAGFGGKDFSTNPSGEDVYGLDGTWYHDQGDKWDGTAPGDPLSDPSVSASPPVSLTGKQGTSPGGAGSFTEGSTNYIRVQDAGNPEPHGWIQGLSDPNLTYPTDPTPPHEPINSNRRVYFGHDMTQDSQDPMNELVLTATGITVSFRMRIPNSGPLDDIYLEVDGDDPDTDPDVVPWFQDAPNGHGTPMTNGRGTLNISQNSPTNEDTSVGFSLVNSTDITTFCGANTGSLCTGTGSGGLIMNNLNGDAPSNFIDSESGGALNILEIDDNQLNEWNEFWITMENNAGLPGNIQVKVYMNGSLTPSTFQVTLAANNNSVYAQEDNPFLEFGISTNDGFGSLDMDFLSYQIGVIAPLAAPVENADFDGDGDVDGRDFLIWQRGYNIGTTAAQGDANGDNMVNAADLAIWKTQYGTPPLSATFASVPEPSAMVLVFVSAFSCAFSRRRRP